MSRQRALDVLEGKKTDRVAQLESLAHAEFFQYLTGLDPYEQTTEAYLAYLEHLDIDATVVDELRPPRVRNGELLHDAHHTYMQWGLKETGWLTDPIYKTVDEILAFDPRAHDSSSLQEKVDRFCSSYETTQRLLGNRALYVPAHYQLVLHYMPIYCDWQVFMETLILEPDKCRFLFDRCTSYSIEIFEALAQTSAPLIIAHEDLCSARGPIFSPDLLRQEVFPRFARIYEPVKRAGKHLLGASDGLIEEIARDLLDAGADGLFFEPMNDIETLADMVGHQGLLWGGGSTQMVTNGTPEEIRSEVQTNMEIAKRLPGFFFSLTGEAPQNVPVENLMAYFNACHEFNKRDS